MVIVMKAGASASEIASVIRHIESIGMRAHLSEGEERTIIGMVGDERPVDPAPFELLSGVERVLPILRPFKLASRDFKKQNTVIQLRVKHRTIAIGNTHLAMMAGPCAVESREQIMESARAVKEVGATILRGGAFKPRTSPYSFQGHGEEALKWLAEARDAYGLAIVTEVMSPEQVPLVAKYADILQIGARNMQNFPLLHAAGEAHKPVLLKRGLSATMEELLMAAEYILSHGNYDVMLCERGIRTFEKYTRNTLDINAVPVLKELSHLPVIVDPSHGTGKWEYVTPIAKAAVAAGADGLIIEVHPDPTKAVSDGAQTLTPQRYAELFAQVRRVAAAVDRTV
ncbi:MAG: 3-deoxy-7-phosphoheptulonate synthase [Chloroflexi bacterium]|jgi:3-deoxy-7-phosphoheptulonate synthase|uniref:3-deoxy-7-phosphoheptulonate synthase n=1 Tax=Candidatus Thermofonsia Clade 3 bacterium TaxID=2364212 RepID=A0A2M8QEZ4_9CHLR|nr:3-deoxy-7-phosphoheptulonate synthase [Candidatus Roseilinea sp. NK_OTU-006]PJF48383.1 MAG: 3-deoxy-7-phosphoheptulonate synthase [Candidatus Thermofonsia Clade 3 bacterium]RMG62532.1 MAG: 3-deoxy-7-phosphoheptulonate synthase [Chloroflexota bacterium]